MKCPACSSSFVTETLNGWICADCGATDRNTVSRKPHHLTGKPSNNRKPDEQRLNRRSFAATDAQWAAYTAAAEKQGVKTQEWMRSVLDAALSK